MKDEQKKKGNKLFLGLVLVAVFFGLYASGALDILQDLSRLQQFFQDLGMVGYGIYLGLYVLVAVFLIPASLFTIVAGITFGSVLGGVLALTGATLGAIVAFLLAKYVARDVILQKFQGNPFFEKIEKGVEENGVTFLILTRLVPIFPYNIQNYAYGISSMKLVPYSVVTFVTMAPGAFLYAFMAGEIATNGVSITLLVQFAVAGVILSLVSLIPKKIAAKKGISLD